MFWDWFWPLLTSGYLFGWICTALLIGKANANKVQELVSPGMYWCVQHGWPIRIIETKPIALRRA